MKLKAVILVTGLILVGIGARLAKAQNEVAPYRITSIPVNWDQNKGMVQIYKVVHQGCELFISVTTGVRDDHSSIATGRGCK